MASASSRQEIRGTSTATARIDSTPHTTCSAEVKPSDCPKKSPLPSTAIDCHQSLKLLATASPAASPVWVMPGGAITFS